MNSALPTEVSILTDVNVLAIALTDDHPAHSDVSPWIDHALNGPNVLLVFDDYPLRVQYLLTVQFGVREVDARNAVQSLIRSPARIVQATKTTLLDAYDISVRKNHDVYDSFLLALARSHEAEYLLTTDTDFEQLCKGEDVSYVNPIPDGKRDVLGVFDG